MGADVSRPQLGQPGPAGAGQLSSVMEASPAVPMPGEREVVLAGPQSLPMPLDVPKQGQKPQNYHFSDFCLFPDRFSTGGQSKAMTNNNSSNSGPKGIVISKSMHESVGRFADEGSMSTTTHHLQATTTPTAPTRPVLSTSISTPATLSTRFGSSIPHPSAAEQKMEFEKFRRRVNSQGTAFSESPSRDSSPKLLYFDFSMNLEKDPRVLQGSGGSQMRRGSIAGDPSYRMREDVRNRLARRRASEDDIKPASPTRQRLYSVGEDRIRLTKIQMDEEMQKERQAQKLLAQQSARPRNTSEPPKFTFFDYSLIPDKMDPNAEHHHLHSEISHPKAK